MAKIKRKVFKIYNLEKAEEQIEKYITDKKTFDVERTKQTIKIITTNGYNEPVLYWYLESTKSTYFLILLNELRKEIQQREQKVIDCIFSNKITDVKYFDFAKNVNEMNDDTGSMYTLTDVYEADVSHAYYRAAYVLGFISKKLYLKIVKSLSKHDRLRLLGCIASVKWVTHFELGEQVDEPELKENKICRSAWFKICHYVDSALIELKDKLDTLFIKNWVR